MQTHQDASGSCGTLCHAGNKLRCEVQCASRLACGPAALDKDYRAEQFFGMQRLVRG